QGHRSARIAWWRSPSVLGRGHWRGFACLNPFTLGSRKVKSWEIALSKASQSRQALVVSLFLKLPATRNREPSKRDNSSKQPWHWHQFRRRNPCRCNQTSSQDKRTVLLRFYFASQSCQVRNRRTRDRSMPRPSV